MTSAEIIELFGSRKAVCDLTGAKSNAVGQWHRIGIPYRHWPVLLQAAQERGIAGITFETLAATKPCRDAAP